MRKNHGFTALHRAAFEGDTTAVERLLAEHEQALYQRDDGGFTALHWATYRNNVSTVTLLCSKGADANVSTAKAHSPLFYAIAQGNVACVQSLLSFGAKVNGRVGAGASALLFAVAMGDSAVVEVLLDAGADPQEITPEGSSLLHLACTHENEDLLKQLLLVTPNRINHQDNEGNTPLHIAAQKSSLAVVKCLLEQGANPNILNDQGECPSHQDEFFMDRAIRDFLHKRTFVPAKSAHISAVGGHSTTFCAPNNRVTENWLEQHATGLGGALDEIRAYLKAGGDPNAQNKAGETALHILFKAFDIDVSRQVFFDLVQAGVEIHRVDQWGNTPCHFMAYSMDRALLASGMLLLKGCVNSQNKFGETPLHWAAGNGNSWVASVLLKAGADPNAVTFSGETPLHFALWDHSSETVTRDLLMQGADPSIADVCGNTLFHLYAQIEGPVEGMALFDARAYDICENGQGRFERIKQSASRRSNRQGMTPIDLAWASEDLEVVEKLIASGLDGFAGNACV
ncbi:Ankyrin repeat-like protein [Magnetococcus marinus MC-1]|uniref:Ankyrin repeat-like protein n=1 Tax=Magnetococcus marinus (strain ATCC BAA-1437 / JCM 17883 / MC-1) TaxID=156889 RepID=A0L957_MAGMM|nr:ankyrin repeat domain-containing protein [Magnetococcus marinus]ABK44500.1 Ankyrin repeat-like protein [Magnetococcus marinus MC-1]